MMRDEGVGRPLDGLRVVEFGQFVAGPYCGMLLADMGADVIKVERPATGELSRTAGGVRVDGEGSIFLSLNRNKRSVTLDMTTPEGRAVARLLVLEADVLVQNLQPGTLASWGLGYAELHPLAPRLVYTSISAFGEDGPYAELAGIDPLIQAMGGLMALTGEAGGPPLMVGAPLADNIGGMNAVEGTLLALFARERMGRGTLVQVSLLDALIGALRPREWDYFGTGTAPARMGSAHRQFAPYDAYQTADGWIYVAVLDDARFPRLMRALGLDELAGDERLRHSAERVQHRDELNRRVAPRFRTRPTADWLATLRAADVFVAPINELPATFRDPQVLHNGTVVTTEHARLGPIPSVRPGFRLAGMADIPLRPPPVLGAHTDEVLAGLGYDAAQIAAFRQRGVV